MYIKKILAHGYSDTGSSLTKVVRDLERRIPSYLYLSL